MDTADIEALDSYLLRLAWQHGTTVRELIRVTAANVDANSVDRVSIVNRGLTVLVRPELQPALLVQQLQVSAPVYAALLPRMTFQCLQKAFDLPSKALATTFKWCACCFHQHLVDGTPPYLRLLWHFEDVDYCHQHRVKLQRVCGECGARQDRKSVRGELHKCVICAESLAKNGKERPLDSWRHDDQDLIDLVCSIAKGEFSAAIPGAVRKSINSLFDEAWKMEQEREFWQLIPRNECIAVVECRMPITFEMVRRYSKTFQISLADLLLGKTPRTKQLSAFESAQQTTKRRRGFL